MPAVKPKDPAKAEAIRRAALRLVERGGLVGLTMPGLGKEAGLGMGTLYVYFAGKEELINTLYQELKQANLERIYAGIDEPGPFEKRLRRLFDKYIDNRFRHFEEHFFVEQCARSPYLNEGNRRLENQAFDPLFMLLDQGRAAAQVKDLDNGLLASFLIGACNEGVNTLRLSGALPTPAWSEAVFELCWHGIRRT